MITKDIVQKLKLAPANLKAKFTAKKQSDGITALLNLIQSRIKAGRSENLADFRMWWAMDTAYDVAHRQTTYSMLGTFMDKVYRNDMSSEQVKRAAADYGVTQFIREDVRDGKKCATVDLPVFFKIHIPLVRAYTNIRWAKLFADRNTFPLLKFEPIKSTAENRARCEIITDIIETMGQQMGYRPTLKQWIFNALHYGTAIMFPCEDWYVEKEPVFDVKDGDITLRVKKQGLRYNIPHPSRVFYDQTFRVGTINFDSGCRFAGYWRIAPFSEVSGNPVYWNTDRVSVSSHDLIQQNPIFFETVYPCTLRFPDVDGTGSRSGAGALDRESHATYYTTEMDDRAVVLTDLFMKLKPKDYDLGDVDAPLWFRFLVANDCDVIYAAPICYTPPLYIGYDAHEERRRNSSLTQEITPFQDHMSNLLSQQILTAKQNLLRVVFANQDLVPQQYLKQILNHGEDLYRELLVIPYSSRKTVMQQNDIKSAFTNIQFPMVSTVELMSAFRLLLDTLERVLVYSAQEVGSVAAHEQTAEETRVIQGSVNNRVSLTDSFVDDGVYAWKRQLYDGLMAYGDKQIYSQVNPVPPITPEVLEQLGFTFDKPGVPGQTKTQIKGPLNALAMEGFVSGREGENRINNPEIAAAMSQFMQIMMSNQMTAMAIGPEQAIEIFNLVARIAGLPRDFKMHVANPDLIKKLMGGAPAEEQQAQMQQMFEKLTEEILNRAGEQTVEIVQKAMKPMLQANEKLAQQITQNSATISGVTQTIEQIRSRLEMIAEAASRRADQSGSAGSGQ